MKIIILTSLPLNLNNNRGGVHTSILSLLIGFSKLPEINVIVFSKTAEVSNRTIVNISENIHIQYYPLAAKGNYFNQFIFFGDKALLDEIRELKPDIIHLQGVGPNLLSMLPILKNDNVIVTQHGIMQEELKYQITLRNRLSFYVKAKIADYTLSRIANIIFISEYNRIILKRYRIKAFRNEVIIHNAVNPLFFCKKTYNKINKIFFVGHISKLKGFDVLLKALYRLKNDRIYYCLEVFGTFKELKYEKKVFKLIKQYNLTENIVFHGWKTSNEIKLLSSNIPIFILPSRQENLPVSIAESMAASKVVIASNISGIPEMIVDGKSGILFEKDDYKSLSRILKSLHENPDKINQIAHEAYIRAGHLFSAENIAKKTVSFYNKCLVNE